MLPPVPWLVMIATALPDAGLVGRRNLRLDAGRTYPRRPAHRPVHDLSRLGANAALRSAARRRSALLNNRTSPPFHSIRRRGPQPACRGSGRAEPWRAAAVPWPSGDNARAAESFRDGG